MSIFSSDPEVRAEATRRYWRWQLFKLIYVLCMIFALPAMIVGFFALYLRSTNPKPFAGILAHAPKARPSTNSPALSSSLAKTRERNPDRSKREMVAKIKPLMRDTNFQIQHLAVRRCNYPTCEISSVQ